MRQSSIRTREPYLPRAAAGQFDAVLHFNETRAVERLERTAQWEAGEVPETFPFGYSEERSSQEAHGRTAPMEG
jgi:hypothetical protein